MFLVQMKRVTVINRAEDPESEGRVLANPRAEFVEPSLFQDMHMGQAAGMVSG